jgi:hypothetical protein
MQTAAILSTPINRSELPSMLATLCSYESWLGPYYFQTLRLMAQVAVGYWQAGEPGRARSLLERVVRDVGRYLGRDHDLRLGAIAALRDILAAQHDYERAGAVQRELLECQVQRLGSDHPETLAARDSLAMILLKNVTCNSNREA